MSQTVSQLEKTRLELLDMGLRSNPLLSFRHSTARTLEIVDERPQQLFNLLVQQHRAMGFLSLPEELAVDSGATPTVETVAGFLAEQAGGKRYTDLNLQTRLTAVHLDNQLLKIQTEANIYFQEQGIDILYLALGFVHWYEAESSDRLRQAPLVLVPVSLERGDARERFKLKYTEADLGPNLTLAAKFKGEFNVVLPEFEELENLETYFDQVAAAVQSQKRWQVARDDVALGFFAFGKFQMYQDLQASNWPQDKQPAAHPILDSLFESGFSYLEASDLSLGAGTEDRTSHASGVERLLLVKDSDSSQTEAVLAVRRGDNLVIQGPPGTGKSQTITNIISQALADKKTVLFVSEKMAALDVVKRRLDDTHLGDAVLELHSHKSNKKAVLKSLLKTMEQGVPNSPERHGELERLTKARQRLDDYCEQVNTPVLATYTTYIQALGKSLQVTQTAKGQSLPDFDFEWMRAWDETRYTENLAIVKTLVAHLKEMGPPCQNPFAATQLRDYSPVEQQKVSDLMGCSRQTLNVLMAVGAQIAQAMQLPRPTSLNESHVIVAAARRALAAPALGGLNLSTDDWQVHRDAIAHLLGSGEQMDALKAQHCDRFIDAIWDADILRTRMAIASKGESWLRIFSGEYRRAKSTLTGLMKQARSGRPADWVAWLDDVLSYQQAHQQYRAHATLGARLFGSQWQETSSDWNVLRTLSDWVIETYDAIGEKKIPDGIIAFLEGASDLSHYQPALQALEQACNDFAAPLQALLQHLGLQIAEGKLAAVALQSVLERLDTWEQKSDAIYQMTRFNRLRDDFAEAGIGKVTDTAYHWTSDVEAIRLGFQYTWYSGLVNIAYHQREAIRQFDRISHEYVLAEFRKLDAALFNFAQESLVSQLFQRLPTPQARGEVDILRREFNKKRRHLPIRRLIHQAGRAIQQIKPVFMMSPMSVATYLEPGALEFDLVVFDEASQVKVADAVGAILRGKQVVVVGDTKQMPPTDFFSKSIEFDDDEAEATLTADIESILGLFLAKGAPERMLRWHYRSRHESLISVSNQEFYDNRLMIFPSPGVNPTAEGLKLVHLSDTYYDRGGSRSNPLEAKAIAQAVMDHARQRPQLTLGVVAFSTAQRDAILNELELARRAHPQCEHFFGPNDANEPFFVKNLENVQGDERDVILISIGYGRTQAGRLSMSFGPLNRPGGERRLNVLISRARLAMSVFSNFTADDMETHAASSFGVRALKSFLGYAQNGTLDCREETGNAPDSPFEEQVISAICGLGYDLESQVGCSGFFIDIAVRDPHKPGRYMLAVECDGATYHSSVSARDRDRLRQSVLQGLGWRFHRIWSTDWFRNAHKEICRLHESIKGAEAYYQALDEEPQQLPEPEIMEITEPEIERAQVEPTEESNRTLYRSFGPMPVSSFGGGTIYDLKTETLARAVTEVIKLESPVHIKRLTQVVLSSYGVARAGARIQHLIEAALNLASQSHRVMNKGDFLYHPDTALEVRNRAQLPSAERKFDWVSDEEIQLAIATAVSNSYSLNNEDATAMALDMLGFSRATAAVKSRIGGLIDQLLEKRVLAIDRDRLTMGHTSIRDLLANGGPIPET